MASAHHAPSILRPSYERIIFRQKRANEHHAGYGATNRHVAIFDEEPASLYGHYHIIIARGQQYALGR